jgi:acyl-CoA thioesterase I
MKVWLTSLLHAFLQPFRRSFRHSRLLPVLTISASLLIFSGCSDSRLSPLEPHRNILAFGDSLTFGTGVKREQSYPAILETLINDVTIDASSSKYPVINSGVPGEVSEKGLQRFSKAIEQYDPALVILCHGGNDILKRLDLNQTKSNLAAMITIAQQNGSQVLLIGVPELALFGGAHDIYNQLAETAHIGYLEDIMVSLQKTPKYKVDSIHLNAAGNRVLAEAIAQYLNDQGAFES